MKKILFGIWLSLAMPLLAGQTNHISIFGFGCPSNHWQHWWLAGPQYPNDRSLMAQVYRADLFNVSTGYPIFLDDCLTNAQTAWSSANSNTNFVTLRTWEGNVPWLLSLWLRIKYPDLCEYHNTQLLPGSIWVAGAIAVWGNWESGTSYGKTNYFIVGEDRVGSWWRFDFNIDDYWRTCTIATNYISEVWPAQTYRFQPPQTLFPLPPVKLPSGDLMIPVTLRALPDADVAITTLTNATSTNAVWSRTNWMVYTNFNTGFDGCMMFEFYSDTNSKAQIWSGTVTNATQ